MPACEVERFAVGTCVRSIDVQVTGLAPHAQRWGKSGANACTAGQVRSHGTCTVTSASRGERSERVVGHG
jgi:hypothetical protein